MRKKQDPSLSGSQRWLQIAVNRCPDVIDSAIADALDLCPGEEIEWLSPLESDCFAEYRDAKFVKRLGVSLEKPATQGLLAQEGASVGRSGSDQSRTSPVGGESEHP